MNLHSIELLALGELLHSIPREDLDDLGAAIHGGHPGVRLYEPGDPVSVIPLPCPETDPSSEPARLVEAAYRLCLGAPTGDDDLTARAERLRIRMDELRDFLVAEDDTPPREEIVPRGPATTLAGFALLSDPERLDRLAWALANPQPVVVDGVEYLRLSIALANMDDDRARDLMLSLWFGSDPLVKFVDGRPVSIDLVRVRQLRLTDSGAGHPASAALAEGAFDRQNAAIVGPSSELWLHRETVARILRPATPSAHVVLAPRPIAGTWREQVDLSGATAVRQAISVAILALMNAPSERLPSWTSECQGVDPCIDGRCQRDQCMWGPALRLFIERNRGASVVERTGDGHWKFKLADSMPDNDRATADWLKPRIRRVTSLGA